MAQLLFEVLTVNVNEMRLFGPRHALITYYKYRASDIAAVGTILNLIVCDAVWAENLPNDVQMPYVLQYTSRGFS